MRVLEAYSDFLKPKIDPKFSDEVLSLNNDEELKKAGISIEKFKISEDSMSLKDKGYMRKLMLFKVKFPRDIYITDRINGRYPLVSKNGTYMAIQVYKDNQLSFRIFGHTTPPDLEIIKYNIRFGVSEVETSLRQTVKSAILYNLKYALEREEKLNTHENKIKNFSQKFDRQYIDDIFSDIFDLCGTGKYRVDNYDLSWHIKLADVYASSRSDYKPTIDKRAGEILSELVVATNRLSEDGLDLNYINTRYKGIDIEISLQDQT